MWKIFELLLKEHGLTVYKFCKLTNTSESTIYTWKKKDSKIGPEIADKICDFFGISRDYLMTGKEPDTTAQPTIEPIANRDLALKIDEIIGDMNDPETSPLYFNGEKLDDKSIAILAEALSSAMKQVEIMRKKK